jgi:hypothetical protein
MQTRVATKCGHKTRLAGKTVIFGQTLHPCFKQNRKSVEYCFDCLSKMAIRCAWCEEPILIGDPITLYSAKDSSPPMPEHAVYYDKSKGMRVGCLGWDCAASGADRAGFWVAGEDGKGQVAQIPTLFELALSTGQPVIVKDLSDPEEVAHKFGKA